VTFATGVAPIFGLMCSRIASLYILTVPELTRRPRFVTFCGSQSTHSSASEATVRSSAIFCSTTLCRSSSTGSQPSPAARRIASAFVLASVSVSLGWAPSVFHRSRVPVQNRTT
jgi:hypothetical protein